MPAASRVLFNVLVLALLSAPAQAGLVGNDLSARVAAADGATTVFYSNWYSTPVADTVSTVDVFFQGSSTPFNLYVLRPTATPNQYNVIYDSGAIVPAGVPNTAVKLPLPNGPVQVQAGDVFAHYGRGIPYSDAPTAAAAGLNAVNPQQIFFSSPAAPVASTTITLNSAAFPQNPSFNRDYAMAVNVPSVVEQVGWGTYEGAAVDGAVGVTLIMDDHGFTQTGNVDKWHFFSNSSATNRFVTPLLFESNGDGSYDVVGVGTPRQNTNAGLQMYDFSLIAGSDQVGPGIFPGFWDGNYLTGVANAGVIEWENAGAGTAPLAIDGGTILLNERFGPGGTPLHPASPFQRAYAVNFSNLAVPEPATAMLGVIAMGCLGLRRRRREVPCNR